MVKDALSGIVVARHGARLRVESEDGQQHRCHSRKQLGAVVCGDRVSWRTAKSGDGIVEAILPRSTLLKRTDRYGKEKIIAANVTQIIVVLSPTSPGIDLSLIDRYLVAAEHLGIRPILLINKLDLLNEAELNDVRAQMEEYQDLGYTVLYTSTKQHHGMDPLINALQGEASVFVGQSGVGKSSLISALLPEETIRIGELSESSGQGAHTTTTARLYHLPQGGDLIDSPGIRDFHLGQLDAEATAAGFIEFQALAQQCRFRDCRHLDEPGCAIKAAVEQGQITDRRWQSYRQQLIAD